MEILKNTIFIKKLNYYSLSNIQKFVFLLCLSWFYALCSQIIIHLPFNFVPISLQPFPLFLSAQILGWPAVYAQLLTLIQTIFGAPFFSGFEGGIIKLLGPTGGYIFGYLIAMIFLAKTRNILNKNLTFIILKNIIASMILYILGLLQLSFFVDNQKLLTCGLYPFLFGCIIKITIQSFITYKYNKR